MAAWVLRGHRAFLLLIISSSVFAQTSAIPDPALGIQTIPLYSQSPSTQPFKSPSANEPTLTVFAPQQGLANGTAVIIAPGGGYVALSSNLEGREVADWFAARGVTAFVLKYRLGAENIYPIPLLDGQRAIRLVRSLAPQFGLESARIGIVGFSAGGHLAAETATHYEEPVPSAETIDQLSSRPDFVVLGYPWLNAMEPPRNGEITYCSMIRVLSPAQCAGLTQSYTPKLHVTRQTPPTFLYATSDDTVVPVSASVEFYTAMISAGAPVEMHLFRHGAHGSSLGLGDAALDAWPELLEHWMRDLGLLTPLAPGAKTTTSR